MEAFYCIINFVIAWYFGIQALTRGLTFYVIIPNLLVAFFCFFLWLGAT